MEIITVIALLWIVAIPVAILRRIKNNIIRDTAKACAAEIKAAN